MLSSLFSSVKVKLPAYSKNIPLASLKELHPFEGSIYNDMNEKSKVRFQEHFYKEGNIKKQGITRQKSLSRTMSTSAIRIRKRRSFWSKETLKTGV